MVEVSRTYPAGIVEVCVTDTTESITAYVALVDVGEDGAVGICGFVSINPNRSLDTSRRRECSHVYASYPSDG